MGVGGIFCTLVGSRGWDKKWGDFQLFMKTRGQCPQVAHEQSHFVSGIFIMKWDFLYWKIDFSYHRCVIHDCIVYVASSIVKMISVLTLQSL